MTSIRVTGAQYHDGKKVKVSFSDNTEKVIDFEPFLKHKPHQVFLFYSDIENFKSFRIENGNLVWGENWDLVFPVSELHQGEVKF